MTELIPIDIDRKIGGTFVSISVDRFVGSDVEVICVVLFGDAKAKFGFPDVLFFLGFSFLGEFVLCWL